MVKLCTLVLIVASGLTAADFTVTVTISNAKAKDVMALITAWRSRQVLDDFVTPKYATNAELGEAVLVDKIRFIVRDQCEFDPANCPAWAKTHLDSKRAAETGIVSEIEDAVQRKP